MKCCKKSFDVKLVEYSSVVELAAQHHRKIFKILREHNLPTLFLVGYMSLKEAGSSMLYVLGGMLLAFVVYHVIGFALNTQDPIVTVVSCSMLPTIDKGDLLIVKGVTFDEIIAGRLNGTIIVYRHPIDGRLIVHRVYKKFEDGTLQTWGDNNPSPDNWRVPMENVVGKIVFRIPYAGYPKYYLARLVGQAPAGSCGRKIRTIVD
jgi:signal peptidase